MSSPSVCSSSSSTFVRHIVLFKLQQGVTESQLSAFTTASAMLTKIPGVTNFRFGLHTPTAYYTGYTERSKGYNVVLECDFADGAALEVYAKHPVHLEFIRDYTSKLTIQEEIFCIDISLPGKLGDK